MGVNLYKKTAGIIGTGKIGQAMARICKGFGMRVIAYDLFPNKNLDFLEYVSLDELLATSDLISLHCPLTDENQTYYQRKDNCPDEGRSYPCKHFPWRSYPRRRI